MVYLPRFCWFYGKCRDIYHSNGWYGKVGLYHEPPTTLYVRQAVVLISKDLTSGYAMQGTYLLTLQCYMLLSVGHLYLYISLTKQDTCIGFWSLFCSWCSWSGFATSTSPDLCSQHCTCSHFQTSNAQPAVTSGAAELRITFLYIPSFHQWHRG